MNGLTIAREIAQNLGLDLHDELLEWVLWNETGWPSFFDGDPETVLRQQLADALRATPPKENHHS